jgi:hypothetical protein
MGRMQGLPRFLGVLGLFVTVALVCGGIAQAGAPVAVPQQPRITETDVTRHDRALTFSQLLDEYLARLQESLKEETLSIQEAGLVEVKLTIRKDGFVTFSEIVVLDGPTALRQELLPLVNRLGPLPPPPVDADLLDVSVLLPVHYPGPDLFDSFGRER